VARAEYWIEAISTHRSYFQGPLLIHHPRSVSYEEVLIIRSSMIITLRRHQLSRTYPFSLLRVIEQMRNPSQMMTFMPKASCKRFIASCRETPGDKANFRAVACGFTCSLWAKMASKSTLSGRPDRSASQRSSRPLRTPSTQKNIHDFFVRSSPQLCLKSSKNSSTCKKLLNATFCDQNSMTEVFMNTSRPCSIP
jgi:hypothetical protein